MIKLVLALFLFFSCLSHQDNSGKILVRQEVPLDSTYKLYWYTDAGLTTSRGLNYFQVAKSITELCKKRANAYCDVAIQIYGLQKDTIYILASTKLIVENKSGFSFKMIEYEPRLYDLSKKPDRNKFYLIDDNCEKTGGNDTK